MLSFCRLRSRLALARTFNRWAEALQMRQPMLPADALARVDREHRLLDSIIDSMNEGVIAADTEGRILLFNAAAKKNVFAPRTW